MLPIIITGLLNCKSQPVKIKTHTIVTEWKVAFGNLKPRDTIINYKYYYDSTFVLKRSERFFKGKIYTVTYYNPESVIDTAGGNYFGNIVKLIVKKKGLTEMSYEHSKLIQEIEYDTGGNEIITRNYNIAAGADTFPSILKHLYGYDRGGKVISDTFLAIYKEQVDTQYEAALTYNEFGKLAEKNFIKTFCCEGHEPFPDDKILYFYDSAARLSREIHIQDLKIKRSYRDVSKEYSTVSVIGYFYNTEGWLSDKKVFAPNLSHVLSFPVEKLFAPPGLEEEYLYQYD